MLGILGAKFLFEGRRPISPPLVATLKGWHGTMPPSDTMPPSEGVAWHNTLNTPLDVHVLVVTTYQSHLETIQQVFSEGVLC